MGTVPVDACRIRNLLVALAAALLAATQVAAGETTTSWQPSPPMPDAFDWVQTTSGEWLKGEIVGMYDEKLSFDSDEFGLQIIDWEDVEELRSAQPMEVSFEGAPTATGRIHVDQQSVQILGAQEH